MNLRAAFVLAALIVGCAPSTPPGSSPAPTAGPARTTAPTTAPTTVAPSIRPTGPAAFHDGPLAPGTYVMTPFARFDPALFPDAGGDDGTGVCMAQDPTCVEDPADDTIRVTLTLTAGFESVGQPTMIYHRPELETGLIILRGASLYSDPCHSTPPPDIAVGPTVDDFANAIADHPLLDATTPADVTLAGFSGKYIDLELPADLSVCLDEQFWPYEPGTYAHGPSNLWHLWILDVDGVRVVIQSMDFAHVSAERRAALQAIVDSISIEK